MYWLLIGLGFPLLTLFTIGLYSVSPPEWTIIQKLSLCFTYFSIVLVFLGCGPTPTVISLDEFIIYFPSHSNTSPYLSWKHHCYWSPFTPWLYNWSLAPGRFHRVHTNPNLFLHLDSYFCNFLPLDMRHHIMILLLLPLLLQSKPHNNTLPITHPSPNLAYLFRTLNLIHRLLNT